MSKFYKTMSWVWVVLAVCATVMALIQAKILISGEGDGANVFVLLFETALAIYSVWSFFEHRERARRDE